MEAISGLIPVAKVRVCGYRKLQNLIIMFYLFASNLNLLPALPCRTTSGALV